MVAACGGGQSVEESDGPLRVVATTSIVGDLAITVDVPRRCHRDAEGVVGLLTAGQGLEHQIHGTVEVQGQGRQVELAARHSGRRRGLADVLRRVEIRLAGAQ